MADDDAVAAAMLARLAGMRPPRLASLLDHARPHDLVELLRSRRIRFPVDPGLLRSWSQQLAAADAAAVARELDAGSYKVLWRGHPAFPGRLVEDPEPAGVLFVAGTVPTAPSRVAVVGTRRCTRYGLDVARDLGRALAAAGVTVVSGLAHGIDAAGHAGALDIAAGAAPLAVVGSGLDRIYPRSNVSLWGRVAEVGAVISEAPPGTAPARWRFPARNRLIAGLADAVVVVESRERGGSMSTVEAALRRDRPVFAVPGPVRSPASAGTNRLIADGAAPMCDVDDVLIAIGCDPCASPTRREAAPGPVSPAEERVLDAVGWTPATLDTVADGAALSLAEAAVSVERLVASGHLVRTGQWVERVAGT